MPPKSPSQKAIEKRLDALEWSLKLKDEKIKDLETLLNETKRNFDGELLKRDTKITELYGQISELTDKFTPLDATVLEESEEIEDSVHEEVATKTKRDLLIIGDSLVRNLDTKNINPGGDSHVECIGGARPIDVIDKFRAMCKTEEYKRVIVHVGTNLIPKYSCANVADKITESLEMIRQLSPTSKVAFSMLLPKESDRFLPGINEVNARVMRGGQSGHFRSRYSSIGHSDFFAGRTTRIDGRLFKKDGIHLSELGERAFERSIKLGLTFI